ncbi:MULTISPECIES: hypothetical protein [Pseudomonas fluorescens group]|uniref:Sigma-70, region 4 n=1 Tax=Pseudomonas koreensis TaxID=198620 RepID=A0AA94JHD7_9PSED|nr:MULTISPECIES: hypothetical protein [Pseudomonas fluorescens group]RVD76844.1 Sigma-70, region 4 [Pseudomonas koreensis]
MSYDREKHTTIVSLFKQGKTLAEIAAQYSLTRQRISQILAARGVSKYEGGHHLNAAQRSAERKAAREKAHMDRYGCTREQFLSVRGNRSQGSKSPWQAFHNQYQNALIRKVEWKLKFWEWWQVWVESGKWEERGRGAEAYCMCRVGDEGAYEVGNVYISTILHNSTLGRTLAFERTERRTALYYVIHSAGGRKAVSEELGLPRQYISQLANNGSMPNCWVADGRAAKLSAMTGGAYTVEDLVRLSVSLKQDSNEEAA